jgi:hypothetical protein
MESEQEGPVLRTLLELQYRLIRARDGSAAVEQAEKLGVAEQHEYKNVYGHLVRWRFRGLRDVRPVEAPELDEGTEVWSDFVDGPAEEHVGKPSEYSVFR